VVVRRMRRAVAAAVDRALGLLVEVVAGRITRTDGLLLSVWALGPEIRAEEGIPAG
jgi:hypothetical protein